MKKKKRKSLHERIRENYGENKVDIDPSSSTYIFTNLQIYLCTHSLYSIKLMRNKCWAQERCTLIRFLSFSFAFCVSFPIRFLIFLYSCFGHVIKVSVLYFCWDLYCLYFQSVMCFWSSWFRFISFSDYSTFYKFLFIIMQKDFVETFSVWSWWVIVENWVYFLISVGGKD